MIDGKDIFKTAMSEAARAARRSRSTSPRTGTCTTAPRVRCTAARTRRARSPTPSGGRADDEDAMQTKTTRLMARTLLFGVLAASATAASARTAGAAPPITATSAELKKDIAQARAHDPESFVAVRSIVTHASLMDAKAQGRKAPVALYLSKLGPKALMPMIDMMSDGTVHPAARRDVVEALGLLEVSARAAGSRRCARRRRRRHDAHRRRSARAPRDRRRGDTPRVGAQRTRPARGRRRSSPGFGECRRVRVANLLAQRAEGPLDAAGTRAVARSLGRVGNAWAWKTSSRRSKRPR